MIGTRFGARVPDTRLVRKPAPPRGGRRRRGPGLARHVDPGRDRLPGDGRPRRHGRERRPHRRPRPHPRSASAQRLFGSRVPAAIGRMSYSLYLWHWPIIVFGPLIAEELKIAAPRERGVPGRSRSSSPRPRPTSSSSARCASSSGSRRPAMAVVSTGLARLAHRGASSESAFLQTARPFAVERHRRRRATSPSPGTVRTSASSGARRTRASHVCAARAGSTVVAWSATRTPSSGSRRSTRSRSATTSPSSGSTRRGCPANTITIYTLDSQGLSHAGQAAADSWRTRVYRAAREASTTRTSSPSRRARTSGGSRPGTATSGPATPGTSRSGQRAGIKTLKTLTSGTGRVVVSKTLPNIAWKVPACLAAAKQDVAEVRHAARARQRRRPATTR